jgi:pyruvate,orthophosphate dikinase
VRQELRSWVVPLADCDPADTDRLGGKGTSLALVAGLGLPVPPAIIATTDLCREYMVESAVPDEVWTEIGESVSLLERATGREFGSSQTPLLVSVRSGSPVSMPGMMDTILNIGLTEETLAGLVELTGDETFAWDSYTRLLKMFAISVRGIPGPALASARITVENETPPGVERLEAVASAWRALIEQESGSQFPEDPSLQLREATEAVLRSWNSRRAVRYREHAGIPSDLGTAVIVQAMVFGNLDDASGSGVAFTRDPTTGLPGLYGDFLARAQGEDVVSGEHDVGSVQECASVAPEAYAGLEAASSVLERRFKDMCDIEFTVEQGKLWILQVRVGQRTGLAEARIAADLVAEGLIDVETALGRMSPAGLIRLEAPVLERSGATRLASGIPASPGAAIGAVVTSAPRAEALAAEGRAVVLVRPETSPNDIAGFIASEGIVTARGGRASHAAVVARGLNLPAVCSVEDLVINDDTVVFGSMTFAEGDEISLDGTSGEIFAGRLPLTSPEDEPQVEQILASGDARRVVPIVELPEGAVVCSTWEEVEEAAGRPIVIDMAAASDPASLLARVADAGGVFLRVDGRWPVSVRRLPAGRWSGLVAEPGAMLAARLLAATAGG